LRRPTAPSPEPSPTPRPRAEKHGVSPSSRAKKPGASSPPATKGSPRPRPRAPIELSRSEARAYLLTQLGLDRRTPSSATNVRALLARLRCIQLDPLDPMGTNADLVAMARLTGLPRGAIYTHAYADGAAFEHFAKER